MKEIIKRTFFITQEVIREIFLTLIGIVIAAIIAVILPIWWLLCSLGIHICLYISTSRLLLKTIEEERSKKHLQTIVPKVLEKLGFEDDEVNAILFGLIIEHHLKRLERKGLVKSEHDYYTLPKETEESVVV